jgi:A/G-specific adenine glycosylase
VYLKYAVINPNRRSAHYRRQAPFENSNRQIRGALLRLINHKGPLSKDVICGEMSSFEDDRVLNCLSDLAREGFIAAENETYRIGL